MAIETVQLEERYSHHQHGHLVRGSVTNVGLRLLCIYHALQSVSDCGCPNA
jgi:hypothetical protein